MTHARSLGPDLVYIKLAAGKVAPNLFVTAGQVSDDIGARALLRSLPDVDWLLGDRSYDAEWFREALKDKGIRAGIPGRKQRKKLVRHDKRRYKRRNRPSRDIAPQCTAGK